VSGVRITRTNAHLIAGLLETYGAAEAHGAIEMLRDLAGPPEPTTLGTIVVANEHDWVRSRFGYWQSIGAYSPAYAWDDFLDSYQGCEDFQIVDPT
jgi:hypothetical protein